MESFPVHRSFHHSMTMTDSLIFIRLKDREKSFEKIIDIIAH